MQSELDLAKELIQQSRRLLYTTKEIMAVLDSNERILNSLLAGLERAGPVDVPDVEYDWSKFPEWANYAATDDDGAIWAYELVPPEPDDDDERWYPDWSGKAVRIVHSIRKGYCPHWIATLRQRAMAQVDVWALVPDEADFVAMDEDAGWWWYTDKPQTSRTGWYSEYGQSEPFYGPLSCDDWTKSLIERPHA